ncbi:MAG: pilus assembly protein [Sandarakinorhabdus sp.]|nr:pilus assembly protein [Sandarakinorhabdus sp.]
MAKLGRVAASMGASGRRRRAVKRHMLLRHLSLDRRGTATIEFALVLPIMVLLVMGLVENVRRNLAMIDVDAAASEGADTALRQGFDAGRIAAAMAAQSAVKPGDIGLIACGGNGKDNGKDKKDKKDKKDDDDDRNGSSNQGGGQDQPGWWRKRGGDEPPGAGNCNGLPQGRYARIVATTQVPSLFGPDRDPVISAVAIVRLP